MKQRISGAIWGLVLILAGVGFAGDAFGLWSFELFFDGWWTLFIILPCLVSIINNGPRAATLIGTGVGVALLLSTQGFLPSHIVGKLLVPFILVAIGANILIKYLWRDNAARQNQNQNQTYHMPQGMSMGSGYSAIFGAREERVMGEFEGTDITSIFGGVELDLRDATISHDITITATAIFGGIDIRLPRNVRVKVTSTPILGGVTNKAGEPSPAMSLPTVFINAVCAFGGVEIKD